MRQVFRDLRRTARVLVKSPAFALVAVLTLALGVGANTAVFSVLNRVILRPLEYHEPERLVRLYQAHVDAPGELNWVSGAAFLDYREMAGGFEAVAAIYNYRDVGFTLTGNGAPRRVTSFPVSADFFDVFHVRPIMGRTFLREEERGSARIAVLSHRLWATHWGGDRNIIGRSVVLDGHPHEVVGVMPGDFVDVVGGDVDLWIPLELQDQNARENRGNHYLSVIARLEAGVSLEEAQARLDVVTAGLAERYPRTDASWFARLVPLHDDVVGNTGTALYVLLGAAGLVLLIACVNVVNLFLARNADRQRELAIRSALGSGRIRLIRQLLTESLAVAVVGGMAGLAVAHWGVRALLALIPDSLPRAREVSPDATLLFFALGTTLLIGVIVGMIPALRFTNPNLDQTLRDTTRTSTGGLRSSHIRNALVTSQVTLALVLLIGAGLLMKSLLKLQQVDLGIAPGPMMTFEVHLPESRYGEPSSRAAFHQALHDRLEAVPGVDAVGAISWLPVSDIYNTWTFTYLSAEGEVMEHGGMADFRVIEGGYFDAMNIGLLEGRQFERTDGADAPLVAIINQSTARRYYEGRDPLGQPFAVAGRAWRVIGVVQDAAHDHRGAFTPKIYLPHAQFAYDRNWSLIQAVSTTTDRPDLVDIARRELAEIDPQLVIHNAQSMQAVMGTAIAREKFTFLLMGIFAAVALSLATVGIYGVLAYSVTQRTREIGIRMALGADLRAVRWAVVRHGAILAAVGISGGLLGAFALSQLLRSLLFEVRVRDPLTFTVVPITLALVALLAGYIPARRATKVDPIEVLRHE
ncbi:MAG: FtsX-like permease family protein [Gemmatimonadales bacterium]|nr:FtsX-like permease family protein [Gemmatimonadales bacterium]NIN11160.1 FtsX-like permease family protein [Gemmatimonadales bacterium]NIN49759.1 FtsX-like permease family protein [Gemmatimonadales bacterium]NIP07223.1 FtsX-like permease family protein [Gemmatimonadales bacterium]NIR00436.1 FtsX-like permease family protein [Gemmatimonadales bacterium]